MAGLAPEPVAALLAGVPVAAVAVAAVAVAAVAVAAVAVAGGAVLLVALALARPGARRSAADGAQLLLFGLLTLPALAVAFALALPAHPAVSSGAALMRSPAEKFPELWGVDGAGSAASGFTGAAFWIWAAGAALLLGRLAWRLARLARWVRDARPVDDDLWCRELERATRGTRLAGAVRLLSHPAVQTPMAWGPPLPFVVLPDGTPLSGACATEARLTLLHELAHLERRDTMTKLLSDVICALFWPLPPAWMARRRLERLQELAADSRVLDRGVRPSAYSAHLLDAWRDRFPRPLPGLSPFATEGPLSERLLAILERDRSHGRGSRRLALSLGLLLLAPATVAAVQQAAVPAPGSPEALHARVAPLIANRLAEDHIAGAALSVVRDGELIYSRGFGAADVFEPRPVDPTRTVFRIGSISKVLTGLAVMQCVERGLLDLDADVNEYLTAFRIGDEFEEPVRVRNLLLHDSGFDQFGVGRHVGSWGAKSTLEEFLRDDLVRVRPPGGLSCYDTYAITLAGYLVEQVSGLDFEAFLQANVFGPLGMARSGIAVPEAFADDFAVGYAWGGGFRPMTWEFMNTDPASTINSTVEDMSRLMRMFLGGGELAGERVLSGAGTRAMLTRQTANHPDHPGMGLSLFEDNTRGVQAFLHSGSMDGFAALMFLVPSENLGVYLCTNAESGRVLGDGLAAVLDELLGPAPEPVRRPRIADFDLTPFAGRYANNGFNHSAPERGGWPAYPFRMTPTEDGGLLFRDRPIYPVGPTSFQRGDDGELFTFVLGPDGAATHLLNGHAVFERLPDRDPLHARLGEYGRRLREALDAGPPEAALAAYRDVREQLPGHPWLTEAGLNDEGYALLGEGRADEALALFGIVADLHPDSPNAWDSLGEARRAAGDRPGSIEAYERALELDPEFPSARQALEELRGE